MGGGAACVGAQRVFQHRARTDTKLTTTLSAKATSYTYRAFFGMHGQLM
jgi:hypothetical protein